VSQRSTLRGLFPVMGNWSCDPNNLQYRHRNVDPESSISSVRS